MKLTILAAFCCLALFAMGAKPARRYVTNPQAANLPFSEAVLVDDTLYIAGHIGVDSKTGQAPADVGQEIVNLLDQFEGDVKQGGMTMDDLVQVTVFCPDLSLYDRFNTAYRARFKKEFPARAFIGSGPLLRGGHFEMMGIAVKR
jgi:2-iminobutanoate/2-iminopropanoate deaminase